ncbi:hypothetical protein EU546_06805 [Candidatus Thorarchaeota archaeon]|jgi:V/A-type H+-transporting ATPase subunit C|nr:MAG: hypothetical protein EU546_06805 [Candidatus Thorarchaeota archaeon]
MGIRAANEYGFINARIRGMKSRFLTVGDYESLLQAPSYAEFMKELSDTYYGQVLSKESPGSIPPPDSFAVILSKDFADVISSLTKSLIGRVSDFMTTYLEFFYSESLKSVVRGVHVGLDREEMLRFFVPTSPQEAAVFSDLVDSDSISNLIDRIPERELRVALLTRFPRYEEYNSTVPLEVAVDEWHLQRLTEALEEFSESEKERVLDIIVPRVVLQNVLTGLRAVTLQFTPRALEVSLIRFPQAKKITRQIRMATTWRDVFAALRRTRLSRLAERLSRIYEATNDLTGVELAVRDHIAKSVKKQLTGYPFHLGTVIGFFSMKQYEIRNLRSIAVGIERGEPAEVIRRMITLW